MKHIALSLLSVVVSVAIGLSARADQIKVIKTSGKRALVEFGAMTPKTGQTIAIGGGAAGGGGGSGARNTTAGGNFEFSNVTTLGVANSTMSLEALYGWVHAGGVMEYGPILGYKSTSNAGTSTSGFKVGGFFDYNLIPNLVGTDLVYGATINATYSSEKIASDNATYMSVEPGGVVKWFFAKVPWCLRASLHYSYNQVSTSAVSGSDTGFKARAGIQAYF